MSYSRPRKYATEPPHPPLRLLSALIFPSGCRKTSGSSAMSLPLSPGSISRLNSTVHHFRHSLATLSLVPWPSLLSRTAVPSQSQNPNLCPHRARCLMTQASLAWSYLGWAPGSPSSCFQFYSHIHQSFHLI